MRRSADLFSGLGGSSSGIQYAGGEVLWVANHNSDAIEWHAKNWPHARHFQQDLSEMDWTGVPEVDYLHASPACQGLSECGQPAKAGTGGNFPPNVEAIAKKHQRDRNTVWAVLAAADSLRPRTLTIENVPRILRWEAFHAWVAVLESLGYHVRTHTLNARDFGGAQDRPRVIITARQGSPLDLEIPNVEARTIGDCLEPADAPDQRWSAIDSKSERMQWRIRKAQREAGSTCFWNNVSESRGRPLSDVFPTSTTKSGSQWNIASGDNLRVVTPRELARSMSFPDSYAIPKNRGLASLLIGNAMDVKLSQSIADQVFAA